MAVSSKKKDDTIKDKDKKAKNKTKSVKIKANEIVKKEVVESSTSFDVSKEKKFTSHDKIFDEKKELNNSRQHNRKHEAIPKTTFPLDLIHQYIWNTN